MPLEMQRNKLFSRDFFGVREYSCPFFGTQTSSLRQSFASRLLIDERETAESSQAWVEAVAHITCTWSVDATDENFEPESKKTGSHVKDVLAPADRNCACDSHDLRLRLDLWTGRMRSNG